MRVIPSSLFFLLSYSTRVSYLSLATSSATPLIYPRDPSPPAPNMLYHPRRDLEAALSGVQRCPLNLDFLECQHRRRQVYLPRGTQCITLAECNYGSSIPGRFPRSFHRDDIGRPGWGESITSLCRDPVLDTRPQIEEDLVFGPVSMNMKTNL